MKSVLKPLGGFVKQLTVGPTFKLIEAVFELIVPLVMASMIDVGVGENNPAYLYKMGALMVGLGLVGLCCALICQYAAARASQGYGTVLRDTLYHKIGTLSQNQLDRFGTPTLITRLTLDVNQLQLAVAMLIRLVVRAPFLVIGATVMAMLLDWKLSLVFLCAAPLVALVLYLIMSRSVPLYRAIQKGLDRLSQLTREGLIGMRAIRAFCNEVRETQRFYTAADDLFDTSRAVGRLAALLSPLTSALINLAILALLWFGGMRVQSGALTQGQIIAFVNYMIQISLALVVVANLVVIFTKAAGSAGRVAEILDLPAELVVSATRSCNFTAPAVVLENVSLTYADAGKAALEQVSLTLEAGERLGIIGGTGSGKTSLVSLISRSYDATTGSVMLFDVDVKNISLQTLSALVGVVPQRAELLSGSLRESLSMGRALDDEDLWWALSVAQAAEFVKALPQGLDSPVMQGGYNFSGGQRQRLSIARALVGRPRILILDDSSSALDYATDLALRTALKRECPEMAVVTVSQRVAALSDCSRILVLEDGAPAGFGSHDTLLKDCAEYQAIYHSQLSGEVSA